MAKKSFIIAGPTASGKSDFAHRLAKKLGGTIINADSVQIYKGIESLSASPLSPGHIPKTDNDAVVIDGVPYKLFSIYELERQISVTHYLEMAKREYDAAEVPIFVGGSGYYINALVKGMSPIPEVSEDNRERARKMVAEAPKAARALTDYEFKDPQRTARALEVFLETGRPITEWQQLPRRGAIKPTPTRVVILPHKEILAPRIRARLPQMIEAGGMDEARDSMRFYADRCIGIEELAKVIRGEVTTEEALETWASRTDKYAKRQCTWFRNQFDPEITIGHIPTEADFEAVLQL